MIGRPEFVLRLAAKPDVSDQDGTRRLRGALKRLLRGYGLRCVECRPVATTGANTSGQEADTTENIAENGGLG